MEYINTMHQTGKGFLGVDLHVLKSALFTSRYNLPRTLILHNADDPHNLGETNTDSKIWCKTLTERFLIKIQRRI